MRFEKHRRQRWLIAVALLLIVSAGLASRSLPGLFPSALGKYLGDALWAMAVLFGLAFLKPCLPPPRLVLFALTISYLVEIAQIYQAPWITTIRATRVGHLILGTGFDWLDLSAYTVGATAGFGLDIFLFCGVSSGAGGARGEQRTRAFVRRFIRVGFRKGSV
ncbi:MAG: DUF2809 domain-containing protein [Opitutus sp.]